MNSDSRSFVLSFTRFSRSQAWQALFSFCIKATKKILKTLKQVCYWQMFTSCVMCTVLSWICFHKRTCFQLKSKFVKVLVGILLHWTGHISVFFVLFTRTCDLFMFWSLRSRIKVLSFMILVPLGQKMTRGDRKSNEELIMKLESAKSKRPFIPQRYQYLAMMSIVQLTYKRNAELFGTR